MLTTERTDGTKRNKTTECSEQRKEAKISNHVPLVQFLHVNVALSSHEEGIEWERGEGRGEGRRETGRTNVHRIKQNKQNEYVSLEEMKKIKMKKKRNKN